jgi:hypothetical protein
LRKLEPGEFYAFEPNDLEAAITEIHRREKQERTL